MAFPLATRRRVFPSEKFPGFFDGTRKQANGHDGQRMINSREIDYVTGANIGDERERERERERNTVEFPVTWRQPSENLPTKSLVGDQPIEINHLICNK